MNTDTIAIDLTLAERHTLADLLTTFIHERAFEAVQHAHYSTDLEKAADKTRRLAHLKALTEMGDEGGCLPVGELGELRADLLKWALESEDTVDEHQALIGEVDDDLHKSPEERRKGIAELRSTSAVDYAHKCVCERIVGQIDAAREAVTA